MITDRTRRTTSSPGETATLSSLAGVRKILVTGMSGTGKSSALAGLTRLGFDTVDTDVGGWTEWSDTDGGHIWREDRITELLACDRDRALFVSGTVSNQVRFYDQFDAVVLLSAPACVLLSRLETRTTNAYGRRPEERVLILRELDEVEPLLRKRCTHEIDATKPLPEVVALLADLGRSASP